MFSAFWRESWNKQICVNKENDPTWYLKIELIEVFLLEGFPDFLKTISRKAKKRQDQRPLPAPHPPSPEIKITIFFLLLILTNPNARKHQMLWKASKEISGSLYLHFSLFWELWILIFSIRSSPRPLSLLSWMLGLNCISPWTTCTQQKKVQSFFLTWKR